MDNEIIEEKKIEFWIHRLLEQHIQEQKKILNRIGELNHQAQHFKNMHPSHKNIVIQDMNTDFDKFEWFKKIKDIEY